MPLSGEFDCLSCGACCANFRVSFFAGECDYHPEGGVPSHLVVPVSPFRVCMQGTEKNPPRCVALSGEIGEQVYCSIYQQRSSTCRNFEAGSEACIKARARHGVPVKEPLLPLLAFS